MRSRQKVLKFIKIPCSCGGTDGNLIDFGAVLVYSVYDYENKVKD